MDKKKKPSSASIVALRFPDSVSKKLSAATKGVAGAIKEGDHHVTMAYMGDDEMDDETKKRVRRAVKMYAASTPPLTGGSFNGTGSFKMGKHGKPFYANVQAKGLYKMREGLTSVLGKEGIKMGGGKPFIPHVTLAYLPDSEKTPQLNMDQDGLQFDALHLKMGDGEYERFPLAGEAKGYDMSGHVDAVRNAWQAKMRDRYGESWWEKGYTVETVEDDAVITKRGGKAYRCPYTMEDGRVRFGEIQPGMMQFIPIGGGGNEYKACTPKHARRMYEKANSDNRVLDVADGNIIFEKESKYFRSAYSGDGDDVRFAKPIPIKMSFQEMDDEDDEETKAGKRLGAPNLSMLNKIQEKLADAVAQLNQVLTWAQYLDVDGKSFPDFLDVDTLAEWCEEVKALSEIDLPPMYLKAVAGKETDKGIVVGGYMAPWGAPTRRDLQLDFFRPETNFFLDHYSNAPALFHHGKDPVVGKSVIGHRDDAFTDDTGLWVQDWLDKSNKFWGMVKALLERRALYYSPGAASHLVERDDNRQLKSYPIVDDTMTPTPVLAPLMMGRNIEYIKSAYKDAGLELTFPDGLGEGAGSAPMSANGRTQKQELALAMLNLQQRAMEAL